MQPELVFHILRTRFWLIGLCVAAVMFVTLLVSANFKPSYEATASIVLELPAGGPLNTTGQPRQLGGDYMMTQVDVLLSRKVALRALQQMDDAMLKLAHDEAGVAGNYIPGEFPETLFAYVSEQLEAKRVSGNSPGM